ncbi:MAG: hypothetical protein ACR2OZ_20410 [Verrucomicrobiales bacterium]
MPRRQRVDTDEELLGEEDDLALLRIRDGDVAPPAPVSNEPASPASPLSAPDPEATPGHEERATHDESAVGEPADETTDEITEPVPERIGFREWLSRFGRNEWMALGGVLLVVLVGAALFFKFLYGGVSGTAVEKPTRSLSVPLKGKLVKINNVEHSWRERRPTDRGRNDFILLPEVTLTIDPAASSQGYLRVIFADSEGSTRGDVASVKFEGGRFKPSNRGEQVNPDGTQASLACTEGFHSTTLFRSYLANEDPRWTLRIEEGADYSKGPWTALGFVEIRNEKK